MNSLEIATLPELVTELATRTEGFVLILDLTESGLVGQSKTNTHIVSKGSPTYQKGLLQEGFNRLYESAERPGSSQ